MKPFTKPGVRALIATAFVGSCLVLAPGNVHATSRGTCNPGKTINFAVEVAPFYKYTTAHYFDVPGTHIDFVQGGASPSCVVVTFSAEAPDFGIEGILAAAEIDGNRSLQNETIFNYGVNDQSKAVFIFPNISPGAHALQIRVNPFGGGWVDLRNRTTIVYHAP